MASRTRRIALQPPFLGADCRRREPEPRREAGTRSLRENYGPPSSSRSDPTSRQEDRRCVLHGFHSIGGAVALGGSRSERVFMECSPARFARGFQISVSRDQRRSWQGPKPDQPSETVHARHTQTQGYRCEGRLCRCCGSKITDWREGCCSMTRRTTHGRICQPSHSRHHRPPARARGQSGRNSHQKFPARSARGNKRVKG